jgi:hypothetical protein
VSGSPWNTTVIAQWKETNSGTDGVSTSPKVGHRGCKSQAQQARSQAASAGGLFHRRPLLLMQSCDVGYEERSMSG